MTTMTPQAALKHYFGYDEFREGQADIINAVLDGRDVLAVRPTGSGKTLCFQLPAMLMQGVTFVVSPLISLMQDQVEAIAGSPVSATLLNSQITQKEYGQRVKDIEKGKYKIVYLAPERLTQEKFLLWLRKIPMAMVVVDEAHCVSQWGGDFRFAYAQIGRALDRLASLCDSKIQRMALSASVTDEVQADIQTKLNLAHPQVSVGGFNRPNLRYRSVFCDSAQGRHDHLFRFLQRMKEGSAIVYCISVKEVERIYAILRHAGFPVTVYHGRLSAKDRDHNQQQWMDGAFRIIVATNAFGMGIDKPDVRMVVHVGYPSSPEDYVQEAGRAGRDGKDSDCIVLWTKQDAIIQNMLLAGRFPPKELLSWVAAGLQRRPDGKRTMPINLSDWARHAPHETSTSTIEQSLRFLEQQGVVSLKRGPKPGLLGIESYNPRATFDYGLVSTRQAKAEKRLRQMKQYLEAVECRALKLVRYFDSGTTLEPCGVCDNCIKSKGPEDALSAEEMAALHLVHATKQRFGRAKIQMTLDGLWDDKVVGSKLHLYTGFGACRGAEIKAGALIKEMLGKNLLRMTVEPKYSVLALTDLGYRLLRDNYAGFHTAAGGDPEELAVDAQEHGGRELTALLKLRDQLAEGYDMPADRIWSREEAEMMATGYDSTDPDHIIEQVLGADRSVQFGFRIIDCLAAEAAPETD
jgi:ATP-dependent DNA helicase RecQ